MKSIFEKDMWKFYKNTFWTMESLFTPILETEELTLSQASILFAIEERENISVGELSENARINKGNCSSTCKKLEKFGYLIRTRNKEDERRVELELTEKGRNVILAFNKETECKYQKVFATLTEEEVNKLFESVEEVNKFFEKLNEV